jgi:hypothetical protein
VEGPEIGIKAGTVLQIPVVLSHDPVGLKDFEVNVTAPAGWKVLNGAGRLHLPSEETTALRVEVQTPDSAADAHLEQVLVSVQQNGKSFGTVRLLVLLKSSGLAQ